MAPPRAPGGGLLSRCAESAEPKACGNARRVVVGDPGTSVPAWNHNNVVWPPDLKYQEYRGNVRRWLPRMRPWEGREAV